MCLSAPQSKATVRTNETLSPLLALLHQTILCCCCNLPDRAQRFLFIVFTVHNECCRCGTYLRTAYLTACRCCSQRFSRVRSVLKSHGLSRIGSGDARNLAGRVGPGREFSNIMGRVGSL